MFWAGVAAVIASFVVNLLPRVPSEPWGIRLQRLLLPVDRVSTFVGQFFAWSIVLLTFAVSYEVFSRYVLGRPTDWAFDASYILYGTLFIMAGAYALSRNAHVRGDFLYRAWRPRTQAWMDLVLYFLFFFPGIIAFIYSGYGFAAQSWFSHEHSAYSPAGPPIYHYKTLIPVTGVLLLLQGIVEVVRCLVCITHGRLAATAPRRRGARKDHSRTACRSGDHAMTDPQLGVLMLVLFVGLIMLGFPIAFTLMAMGVGFAWLAFDGNWEHGDVAAGAAHLVGDDQRHPDLGAAVRVHGLHRRARQHPRPAVPLDPARRRRVARFARHRHAGHLRPVRHRHRHRRRGRDADGPAGLPGHAAARL